MVLFEVFQSSTAVKRQIKCAAEVYDSGTVVLIRCDRVPTEVRKWYQTVFGGVTERKLKKIGKCKGQQEKKKNEWESTILTFTKITTEVFWSFGPDLQPLT